MIRAKLIFLARNITIDQLTNTVSVFSIIEEMYSDKFPVGSGPINLFIMLEKESSDTDKQKMELQIFNNEMILHNISIDLDFQSKNRLRQTININNLVLNSGTLKCACVIEKKEIGSYYIRVEHSTPIEVPTIKVK